MATASSLTVFPASTSSRQLWRFGILCGIFALLWAIGSFYGLGINSPLDTLLCNQLTAASAWGLRLAGWVASPAAAAPNLLMLNGQPGVIVGPPCDGLVLYVLLAGFVLAYPGPTRRRVWFIPLGIAVLWLLNVVRIMALALNHQYSPETFEFDHHYGFNAIAYSVLGGLWLLWTRQSSSAPTPADAQAVASAPLPASTKPSLTTRSVSGIALLLILVLINIFHTQILQALSVGWAAALTAGPAWLRRLPGADAGTAPAGVSHLALPVGMAYVGLFLVTALLVLYLLVPARSWRLVWGCYAGMVLVYVLLLAVGHFGALPSAYRIARMLLDFLASLLPVAGLLVLLWRPTSQPLAPTLTASEQPALL